MEVARSVIAGIRAHHIRKIVEESQTGSLRREVAELSGAMGLNKETAGRAAIVATELGTNLVKHTSQGGEVLFKQILFEETAGIELISIDRGPGMTNPARMLEDGVSTAGSPGNGLGAMKRLSDEFALYSSLGVGTAILSRIWNRRSFERVIPSPGFEWGAVNLPKTGQDLCGDGWGIVFIQGKARVLVVDGLGHGPGAATAAHEAVRAFIEPEDFPPVLSMSKLHQRLLHTRGAAVAIAEISPQESLVTYVGVGNIFGRIINPSGKTQNLVTMNGTLGYELIKMQPFAYPWQANAVLIMNSDGLLSNWDLAAYPGIENHHPALIAAMAYRDNNRGNDDLTVVAIRQLRRQAA